MVRWCEVVGNRRALEAMCYHLTHDLQAFPAKYDARSRNSLSRCLVFYCNAGEHRSVAFAALVGDMLRQQGVKVLVDCKLN